MREIKICCVAFVYSCIRLAERGNSILSNSIHRFLSDDHKYLIVINDLPNVSEETVIKELNLDTEKNIIICSYTNQGWLIYDHNKLLHEKIEKPLSVDALLGNLQNRYEISKQNTISVGAKECYFSLKDYSILHFYVGTQEELTTKIRGLIPLTDQYELGLSNILTYFVSHNYLDNAIDYNDLIAFVGDARNFFKQATAAQTLLKKHSNASFELLKKFPEEIIAIFGTGFPFYMLDAGFLNQKIETPTSILNFYDIQYEYFRSKIVNEKIFIENQNQKFSSQEMFEKFGLNVFRNEFDNYKYEKMNYLPPDPVKEILDFDGYFSNACFDIASDLWSCYYCVTLQSKNTNVTCLPCKQTSFMLRNLMSCTPDIDLVIVVKKDKNLFAERLENFITQETPYHLYDTDFHKTLIENEGPIDLFVTEKKDLSGVFPKLLKKNWVEVTFTSIALWSPNIEYKAQLGMSFPLAFEPVIIKDEQLSQAFFSTRKKFSNKFSSQLIIEKLSKASFYTKQLMSNKSIIDNLIKKMSHWKKC